MSRELKFRAWVYYGDKLEKPHYSSDYGSLDRFFEDHDENDPEQCIEQYTGLKDKNGKEIYEGDIIKAYYFEEQKMFRVVFFEYRFGLAELDYKDYNLRSYNVKDFQQGSRFRPQDDYEIIGNIHENPELLEVKNEKR